MRCAEQLSFFDIAVPTDARYKAVATIDVNAEFQQEFHPPDQVPKAVEKMASGGHNTFLSISDFRYPSRSGASLFGFSGFGYDIDCHDSSNPARDAYITYQQLKESLFGSECFPMPSMVEHTGRGLLVVIAFERRPKQILPLWLQMGERWATLIRAHLPECAVLDNTYSDAARIVRVPGTYNTKANREAVWLDFHENYPTYLLEELRDAYFPDLNPKHYKAKSKPVDSKPRVIYTNQNIQLHVDRAEDILKLCELRAYAVEGKREIILFLYRYWTCFYIGVEAALNESLELNRRFSHPLPEREVVGATRSAETAFQRWRDDHRTGYNYRNSTLVKLLEITPEEQRELKTIISTEEKQRRRQERGWDNGSRIERRRKKALERERDIYNLVIMGYSQRKICSIMKCDRETIKKAIQNQETQNRQEGFDIF